MNTGLTPSLLFGVGLADLTSADLDKYRFLVDLSFSRKTRGLVSVIEVDKKGNGFPSNWQKKYNISRKFMNPAAFWQLSFDEVEKAARDRNHKCIEINRQVGECSLFFESEFEFLISNLL